MPLCDSQTLVVVLILLLIYFLSPMECCGGSNGGGKSRAGRAQIDELLLLFLLALGISAFVDLVSS